ncbi:peroxide/acid stress response protein YhcN [Erwinia psidii]|uniref:DUF1471 domain-containing protein n=1 Tax=Erwinia psidii TaxID=69224 RepID=A0A3N6UN20_9GAMM|nr:peroxide/acid stress response protein YhcN [Erwinia psidii]RQM37329.1 DUF1471 domain-containing protein [Erwinia psidii]
MKFNTAIATLSVLFTLSSGAFAADSVNRAQAQNMQSLGTISVSGVNASPMDIRDQLNQKAESRGATAWSVTEAYNNGNYHVTAELYK